jgi:multidrug efflux pump subunit AcrA (membrane-fusion protein)
VDPAARTAKVRIEVANPAGALRLGMFVSVSFTVPSTGVPSPSFRVPRFKPSAAAASCMSRRMARNGRFTERAVTVGASVGETSR